MTYKSPILHIVLEQMTTKMELATWLSRISCAADVEESAISRSPQEVSTAHCRQEMKLLFFERGPAKS